MYGDTIHTMLLSAKALEKQYGSHTVLNPISFTIDEGHKIALVGRNGAGKSTLMRILSGDEEPDNGSVTLTNGRTLAYAPQEMVLDDEEQTGECIPAGARIQGTSVHPYSGRAWCAE